MRFYIGRGLQLSALLSSLFALFLGLREEVRPGKELMILAGSACLFFIGWILVGGKK